MTVLQDLIDSRDLIIRDGWSLGRLRGANGSHCAMGAVLDTTGNEHINHSLAYDTMNERGQAVTAALYEAIPAEKRASIMAEWGNEIAELPSDCVRGCIVGDYNNYFGESTVIEMFNVAIAQQRAAASTSYKR
jgi:predicted transcriptional regulator with HTH domain